MKKYFERLQTHACGKILGAINENDLSSKSKNAFNILKQQAILLGIVKDIASFDDFN